MPSNSQLEHTETHPLFFPYTHTFSLSPRLTTAQDFLSQVRVLLPKRGLTLASQPTHAQLGIYCPPFISVTVIHNNTGPEKQAKRAPKEQQNRTHGSPFDSHSGCWSTRGPNSKMRSRETFLQRVDLCDLHWTSSRRTHSAAFSSYFPAPTYTKSITHPSKHLLYNEQIKIHVAKCIIQRHFHDNTRQNTKLTIDILPSKENKKALVT